MARGDLPAFDLGAMGDDAMPLQRQDIVHLLVQQPFFELADVGLALLGVGGATLLVVELVQGTVGVAAVVGRVPIGRLDTYRGPGRGRRCSRTGNPWPRRNRHCATL